MKLRKEKITIKIENYSRTTWRIRRGEIRLCCELCAPVVPMISPSEAAALLETTVREIFRRVENGAVHFTEIENGELLVCPKSLEDFPSGESKRIL